MVTQGFARTKIKLSNLHKLIFGIGRKNNKKSKESEQSNAAFDTKSKADAHFPLHTEPAATEAPALTNKNTQSKPGHGHLPHPASINTTEHQLSIADYKTGVICPKHFGGKL